VGLRGRVEVGVMEEGLFFEAASDETLFTVTTLYCAVHGDDIVRAFGFLATPEPLIL